MIISEVHMHVDVGSGIWSGVLHCQPPLSPNEWAQTMEYGVAEVRTLCQRQCLRLSALREVQISFLRVETVEDAELPSTLEQMPVVLPGHRRERDHEEGSDDGN
jgi:hypothetical protein